MFSHANREHHTAAPGLRQWVAAIAFLALAAYLSLQYQAHGLALLPLGLAIAVLMMHVLRLRSHARRHHRAPAPPRE